MRSFLFVLLALSSHVAGEKSDVPGAASFVVPAAFPTSVFSSYYGIMLLCLHPANAGMAQTYVHL